jgi:hypothetical protein
MAQHPQHAAPGNSPGGGPAEHHPGTTTRHRTDPERGRWTCGVRPPVPSGRHDVAVHVVETHRRIIATLDGGKLMPFSPQQDLSQDGDRCRQGIGGPADQARASTVVGGSAGSRGKDWSVTCRVPTRSSTPGTSRAHRVGRSARRRSVGAENPVHARDLHLCQPCRGLRDCGTRGCCVCPTSPSPA